MGLLDFRGAKAKQYFASLQDLTPPPKIAAVHGGHKFLRLGKKWGSLIAEYTGIAPGASVLDIGCGAGRLAIGLAPHVGREAKYVGFDINEEGIRWAKENIEPRWKNASFSHFDIQNTHYNSKGGVEADQFRFPYADESFDLAILTSGFTHFYRADTDHYLSEIRRVLKKDGLCLSTWFDFNSPRIGNPAEGVSRFNFAFDHNDGTYSHDERKPLNAIAYDEKLIYSLHEQNGFKVTGVHMGGWRNPESREFRHSQDVVVAKKSL